MQGQLVVRQRVGLWNIEVEGWSMEYLGLPLGAKPRFAELWDLVIEKISKKLASQKVNNISKGGRISLIQSTYSNLCFATCPCFRFLSN